MFLSITCPLPLNLHSDIGSVAMAKDPLAEAGLHFDELNKLRVLEPEVGQKTTELKEECKEFVDSKRRSQISLDQYWFPLAYIII